LLDQPGHDARLSGRRPELRLDRPARTERDECRFRVLHGTSDEREEMSVVLERNVAAKMRDGTILRADVYRPSEPGRYPVLVTRTPYNKQLMPLVSLDFDPIRGAEAGYVIVIQDVRARWASDGDV